MVCGVVCVCVCVSGVCVVIVCGVRGMHVCYACVERGSVCACHVHKNGMCAICMHVYIYIWQIFCCRGKNFCTDFAHIGEIHSLLPKKTN